MKNIYSYILLFFSFYTLIGQETKVEIVPIVLGKKLVNAYSVENMQKAFNSLSKQKKTKSPLTYISANHLYVRFLPKDNKELHELMNVSILELFDHPLDYEIEQEGNYYHDPSIPDDRPTWYYTVIKIEDIIPEAIQHITYQVLEELFLPPDNSSAVNFYTDLEEKSLILTKNSVTATRSPKYRPSGQILVSNPISGSIYRENERYDGVPNVVGRVRKWFKISKGITDNDGYFQVSKKFRGKVNFGVIYKNQHASILPGPFSPLYLYYGGAFLDGPRREGHWEYRSHRGTSSYKWGAIMRGVHDYHYTYAPNLDILPPPNKLRIAAFNFPFIERPFAPMFHQQDNQSFGFAIPGDFSDIYIDQQNKPYHNIYDIVIHELGHAAHWRWVGNWAYLFLELTDSTRYKQSRMATEAWADGIADYASKFKFNLHSVHPYACNDLDERIDDLYPKFIVRDLMDNKQSNNTCTIVDNVSGFNHNQIFYALESSRHHALEKWRDNLIQKDPSQEEVLREYFAQWIGEEYVPCSAAPLVLNTDYTSEENIDITHSNTIFMKNGFYFKPTESTHRFRGEIVCNYPGAGSQMNRVVNNENTFSSTVYHDDFKFIPNQSIVFPPKYLEDIEEIIVKENADELLFYPIPVDDVLYVKSSRIPLEWRVIDITGKTMTKGNFKSDTLQTIHVNNLPKGMYFVKVNFLNGTSDFKRILKN
ncbi:T9SS type A sorting domain-containing protein [Tenacibaculum jejuense]|uniref:Secretion system C-terminal sorting domain-containing protein n=1 Tax=Tenacibaculum jejuense TaxID=584609 RepID=A0A238U6C0_9FLAO|nr:T9SS type A sorting domain-containing protein [Tenacibaculum jejuense]SNR14605.1 Protein of unknown function containing a C-terminal secretion signal [Tenacibaculum jejuense]